MFSNCSSSTNPIVDIVKAGKFQFCVYRHFIIIIATMFCMMCSQWLIFMILLT